MLDRITRTIQQTGKNQERSCPNQFFQREEIPCSLKKHWENYTHNVYRKEFSKYRFRDINESFLMAFVLLPEEKRFTKR